MNVNHDIFYTKTHVVVIRFHDTTYLLIISNLINDSDPYLFSLSPIYVIHKGLHDHAHVDASSTYK